ncbi:MAG: hypothetical protein ACUVRZ_12020 [Desulfobacca sp.]|uniref:hypothetical protein n=1 Tax=Desulfobacca sp. TaxID=2067990 RepID=UPI00404AD96E
MSREEARLATVQSLSQGLLQELAPQQAAYFDQDFALWLATPRHLAARERLPGDDLPLPLGGWPGKTPPGPKAANLTQGLDTTLVAGMFLQVILEAEQLPGTPLERTCFVKQAVKNFLVQRLAGQITLSQFFRLVQLIEEEVGYYFQRLQGQWLNGVALSEAPQTKAAAEPLAEPQVLRAALEAALRGLPLPQQANRKLSPEGLLAFLLDTRGRWFRLLDFEAHFRLNKKTAWSYLTLLLQQQILRHNEQRANRVRYALAEKFLAR